MSKYSNEEIGIKGLRIEFHYSSGDSRDNDNLTKMVCFHQRYDLGDEDHGYNKNDYNSWEELADAIKEKEDVLLMKPLYLYDHSGLTISTDEVSCKWDSGQIGFVYITKETADLIGAPKETFDKQLEGEVETYNTEIQGEVFGFTCYKNGKEVDSCGGFYGRNPHTNGMFEHIPEEFEVLIKDVDYLEVE